MNQEIRFGVIGCGLMGREFASASMRWLHLAAELPRPVIVAACDLNPANLDWFHRV
ncbi:MAG: gfo/Idh/MocA family oxidoreductase, partial [Clostridia bacterium]